MSAPRVIGVPQLLGAGLKLVAALIAVSIPGLGVWIASSLAAAASGPTWLVVLAGLLAFPIGPLVWDALGAKRRRARRPMLTFGDRMILRTLAINGAFVGGLLWIAPEAAFTATSARGDWMLDDRTGPSVERARALLHDAADGLEWLYELAHDNAYAKADVAPQPPPPPPPPPTARRWTPRPSPTQAPQASTSPTPSPTPSASASVSPTPSPTLEPRASDPPAPSPEPVPPAPRVMWPLDDALHPAVKAMTPDHETGPAEVARALVRAEPDRALQVKAIHDWIADRISYDRPSLDAGVRPPQDAGAVFAARTGVCEGYARLFVAMTEAVGIKSAYIVGASRDLEREAQLEGIDHAWNAVEIDGEWHLLDVTWDSPHVRGKPTEHPVRSVYLFTPPEVFGISHFPEDERWQLRSDPISRGAFIRQPIMKPSFYAEGLELVAPDRSQVSAKGALRVRIKNPQRRYINLTMTAPGSETRTRCGERTQATDIELECRFDVRGVHQLIVFSGPALYGTSWGVGGFQVTND